MIISIVLGILSLSALFFDHYFLIAGNNGLSVFFKGTASACFVILAVYSLIRCKQKSETFKKFAVFCMAGITIAFIADIVIELNFVIGFCLFVSAQTFYFLSFSHYRKYSRNFFIGAGILFFSILLFDFHCPFFNFGDLKIPVVVYILALSCVVIKSFDSFRWKAVQAKTMPVGIALFALSDFMLQFYVFPSGLIPEKTAYIIAVVSNVFYYVGQLLVAFSLSKDFIAEK